MFVMAGSASTQATDRSASAAASPGTSLNSATTVVSAGSTGGPTLPARATVPPSGPRTAKASSTDP